jgi:tetratricopeptide (TPR) repeat protein
MMTGRPEEAVATADRSLGLTGRGGAPRPVVEALINKGTALLAMGRITEAAALLRGAAAEADRHGMAFGSLRARNNLLGIASKDSNAEGLELMREGYELSLRLGNEGFAQQFLMLLGYTSIWVGDFGAWLKEIEAVEEQGTELNAFYRIGFAGIRAVLAGLRGNREEAARHLDAARAAAPELDSRLGSLTLSMIEADVARSSGDWATAARLGLQAGKDVNYEVDGNDMAAQAAVAGALGPELAEAIATLEPLRGTGRLADAAIAAAEAGQLARAGRWEEARAGYRRALTLRREAAANLEGALDGLNWGLLAGDRDPEAKTALTEAEAFFAWRGATPMVNIYKAAFVPLSAGPVARTTPPASVVAAEVGTPAPKP